MSYEFIISSIIVSFILGVGVIYALSIGINLGGIPSLFVAIGCSLGLLPHVLFSLTG